MASAMLVRSTRDGELLVQCEDENGVDCPVPGSDGTWLLRDLDNDSIDPFSVGQWTEVDPQTQSRAVQKKFAAVQADWRQECRERAQYLEATKHW